jgi:uncharacterized protein (TIGR03437 family)
MHFNAAFAGTGVDALWRVMCLHWATHVHYDAGGIAVAFQKQFLLVAMFGVQATALAQTPTPTTADLFDGSVLHEVRMTMSPYTWQAVKDDYLSDAVFTVDTFQWTGAGGKTASVGRFQMHNRGNGSRSPIKPGLHLTFDAIDPAQTFLGLTALELKPNTQDASMLHERLSMLLFGRMGIPCSREVHSRFYVNGEYIGVYLLVEYPDKEFLTRIFNESTGYEYNYVPGDWATPLIADSGYHFEYLGPVLSKYASSSVTVPTPFSPETHTNAPDTVTLEGMIRTMNQELPDDTFLSAMAPYLDLKLFLTHIAVETYVADFDCILGKFHGMNNFHFYRFVNKQLSQFIPWDKDGAFSATVQPVLQNADQNVLMRRLMAIPDYKQYYFQALVKTATSAMAGGWLQQEATREYNQIQQAAYDDNHKLYLNYGNLAPCDNACFDAAAAFVVAFAPLRTQFVMADIVTQGYPLPSNYPKIADGGVVSAASSVASPARGGLASIYGSNLGNGDNTTVYINGFVAPVLFAKPDGTQFNVQIPWEVTGMGTFSMIVNGTPSNVQSVGVATYSPDVFAITHTDGSSPVTDTSPATANETVVVYATGLGPVTGAMITGKPASSTSLQPTTPQPATAMLGGIVVGVGFSGLTPGFIGLYQVNVYVPANVPPGSFLSISIGGQLAPPVPLPTQ